MLEQNVGYKPDLSLKNACSLCRMAFGEKKVLICRKCQQGLVPKRKIYKHIIRLSFFAFLLFVRFIARPAITWFCDKGVPDSYSILIVFLLMLISAFVIPFIVSWISLPFWKYIKVTE